MLKRIHCLSILSLIMINAAITASADSAFRPIFDGKTLDGWDGDPRFWRVENGAIVGETTADTPTQGNTFLIWEGGEIADFELKVEFKIRNHNSGIQYRSFRVPNKPWVIGGYQADISADHKWTGTAYGEKHKGILAKRGEKAVVGHTKNNRRVVAHVGDSTDLLAHLNKDGWNEYHIIAVGNQCIQRLNGVVMAEFSEATDDRLSRGLIALQLHAGPPMQVRFRNLRLRKLSANAKKKVLLLAGSRSHGHGAHEHKAGCHLLARCLHESGLDVMAHVATEGKWPEPWTGYDAPDAVVMFCDGYTRHPAKTHKTKIQSVVDRNGGVACLHFGVEVHKDELGDAFLNWIGGYFENGWSVNPFWTPTFEPLPDHPISNGVTPFEVRDEWYYHMRFQPDFKNTTAILSAKAPLKTLKRHGSRGSNPTVRAAVEAGVPQVLAWAYDRPGGGRGFGFTGGHFHKTWALDDFRTLVLNAIQWTAGGAVPQNGVASRTPTPVDLEQNQDYSKQ